MEICVLAHELKVKPWKFFVVAFGFVFTFYFEIMFDS